MMTPFTTSLVLVAGICAGFGILYLFVGWRRARDKILYLTFALFSLSYAGSILTAAAGYRATDVTSAIGINTLNVFFVVPAYVGLVWFVATYTKTWPRIFLWLLSALFVVLGLAIVSIPGVVGHYNSELIRLTLPWGETVALLDEAESPLILALILAQLATIGFIAYACFRQYRRGEHRAAVVLGVGVAWFVATLVGDILIEAGVMEFVFMTDFGFLGFAVAMSLQMADSVIRTEEALARQQDQLESLVEERTADLQEANERLVVQERLSAAVEERRRLASELHDSVTQTLYSVSLVAAALPRLLERNSQEAKRTALHLRNMTLGALAEMRTLLYELRPEAFNTARPEILVQQAADVFTGRTHVPVEVTVKANPDLPAETKRAFYRIVQEAFNNTAKHAEASRVTVALNEVGDGLVLHIEDDGRGFDIEKAKHKGLGLSIIRERALDTGASVLVDSREGQGTRITVCWPENNTHE